MKRLLLENYEECLAFGEKAVKTLSWKRARAGLCICRNGCGNGVILLDESQLLV